MDKVYCNVDSILTEKRVDVAGLDPVVGYHSIELGEEPISVFARFTGINHNTPAEPKAYEVGITGDPEEAAHKDLHGRHEIYVTRAECLASFEKLKAELDKKKAAEVAAIGP